MTEAELTEIIKKQADKEKEDAKILVFPIDKIKKK